MATCDIEIRHRTAAGSIAKKTPERRVIDLTSRAEPPWVRFSPFYPHGAVPIPWSGERVAASVEGIWQGLKVFEHADVDERSFANTSMRRIKRGGKALGRVLGHRRGVAGAELLDYLTARLEIYLPLYQWVLRNRLANELAALIEAAREAPLSLLDFETNCDPNDLSRPLSHAALVAREITAQLG